MQVLGTGPECLFPEMVPVGRRGPERSSKQPTVTQKSAAGPGPASLLLGPGQGSGYVTESVLAVANRPHCHPRSPFPFLPLLSASPWFLFPLPPPPCSFFLNHKHNFPKRRSGQVASTPGHACLSSWWLRSNQGLQLKHRGLKEEREIGLRGNGALLNMATVVRMRGHS